jgi:hypothetical protein
MLSEALPNSRAPSLRGHYPASSLPRARPPPSRRRPLSRGNRLYGLPSSADFAAGRGGLLQLPDVSCAPCRRSHPAGGDSSRQPDCDDPCCLRAQSKRSASGIVSRGYPCVHSRYSPATRSHPSDGSSIGSRALVSRRPAIQATGRLAVAPVGLPPTEHVCLFWTHTSRTITALELTSRSRRTHRTDGQSSRRNSARSGRVPKSVASIIDMSGGRRRPASSGRPPALRWPLSFLPATVRPTLRSKAEPVAGGWRRTWPRTNRRPGVSLRAGPSQAHEWSPGDSDALLAKDRWSLCMNRYLQNPLAYLIIASLFVLIPSVEWLRLMTSTASSVLLRSCCTFAVHDQARRRSAPSVTPCG